ncbi:hypothetical protein BD779DRAFT_483759 [Infundibulicybe gibba]|nr:hypothetical protein BD779DRAFT_483759 [Infundibulicybe gibba]
MVPSPGMLGQHGQWMRFQRCVSSPLSGWLAYLIFSCICQCNINFFRSLRTVIRFRRERSRPEPLNIAHHPLWEIPSFQIPSLISASKTAVFSLYSTSEHRAAQLLAATPQVQAENHHLGLVSHSVAMPLFSQLSRTQALDWLHPAAFSARR